MKHIFRRFGGTFQGGDGGSIGPAIIGAAGLVLCCVTMLFTGDPKYLLAGFAWLFLFTVISLFGRGGATSSLKKQLHKEYLIKAIELYNRGEFHQSNQYFIKVKMHGAIPTKHVGIYREVVEKSMA
jgi:hypothetical protein